MPKTSRTYSAIILTLILYLATSPVPLSAETAGKPDEREQLYNNACRTCHLVKDGQHRLGPSLFGVIGRKAGTVPGYRFSSALSQSGIVWDEATLDRFLAEPDLVAPGNNMRPFTALKSPEQRAAIIAFLKEKSAN